MKKQIDQDFFSVWTEESAYLFGYLLADGCIWKGKSGGHIVRVSSKDYEIVFMFKELLASEHKIYQTQKGQYTFEFSDKKMYEDLLEMGLKERKSTEAVFPENIPDEMLRHVIRGYFDGNGSFVYTNHRPGKKKIVSQFVLKNKDFGNGLKEACSRLGVGPLKLSEVNTKGTYGHSKYFTIRIYVKDTRKLYEMMYKDATVFLERKKDYYDQCLEEMK